MIERAARAREWLRPTGWGLCLGHGGGRPHAPLPRAADGGAGAPDRSRRAGERLRRARDDAGGAVRDLVAALPAGRDLARRRGPARRVRVGSVAALALPARGRHGDRAGAVAHPRRAARGGALARAAAGAGRARACASRVRPFLCGRDYHALHRENPVLAFGAAVEAAPGGELVTWRTYGAMPAVTSIASGRYRHEPHWYRGFSYAEEAARGLDRHRGSGVAGRDRARAAGGRGGVGRGVDRGGGRARAESRRARRSRWRTSSPRRRAGPARALRLAAPPRGRRLPRSARRGPHRSSRATRGSATGAATPSSRCAGCAWPPGRLDEALGILLAWAGAISQGMVPNRFPDRGAEPEYNAVDASLWYVIAAGELLDAAARAGRLAGHRAAARSRTRSRRSSRATRRHAHGIHLDKDGLLAAGGPGVQRTWMDARVGDRGDAARGQAGRDPGAVAERARGRRAPLEALAADPRARRGELPGPVLGSGTGAISPT